MRRICYAVIGIEEAWQFYVSMVTLADGLCMCCKMPAPFPPDRPIPLHVKHLLWRDCVAAIRLVSAP